MTIIGCIQLVAVLIPSFTGSLVLQHEEKYKDQTKIRDKIVLVMLGVLIVVAMIHPGHEENLFREFGISPYTNKANQFRRLEEVKVNWVKDAEAFRSTAAAKNVNFDNDPEFLKLQEKKQKISIMHEILRDENRFYDYFLHGKKPKKNSSSSSSKDDESDISQSLKSIGAWYILCFYLSYVIPSLFKNTRDARYTCLGYTIFTLFFEMLARHSGSLWLGVSAQYFYPYSDTYEICLLLQDYIPIMIGFICIEYSLGYYDRRELLLRLAEDLSLANKVLQVELNDLKKSMDSNYNDNGEVMSYFKTHEDFYAHVLKTWSDLKIPPKRTILGFRTYMQTTLIPYHERIIRELNEKLQRLQEQPNPSPALTTSNNNTSSTIPRKRKTNNKSSKDNN